MEDYQSNFFFSKVTKCCTLDPKTEAKGVIIFEGEKKFNSYYFPTIIYIKKNYKSEKNLKVNQKRV